MRAVISAVSALKISSKRCVGIGDVAQDVVHGAGAGGHLGGDALAARGIAGPYTATQRKRAGVGERDRVGFICERSDADDRAERFFGDEARIRRNVAQNDRLASGKRSLRQMHSRSPLNCIFNLSVEPAASDFGQSTEIAIESVADAKVADPLGKGVEE